MVAVILVDANIWIFAEMSDYPEHGKAKLLIEKLLLEDIIATNVIVVSEVYYAIARMVSPAAAKERILSILASDKVRYMPIPKETAVAAAGLAESKGLRINDAMIAQQALDEHTTLLTDNARHFKKVGRLKLMPFR